MNRTIAITPGFAKIPNAGTRPMPGSQEYIKLAFAISENSNAGFFALEQLVLLIPKRL